MIDVQLAHGRQFEVSAELELDIIEDRLKEASIAHFWFDFAGHIHCFRQDVQVVEIELCFSIVVLEKCLEGDGNERPGYRLTVSPFLTDLAHDRISSILSFAYQALYHSGRYEQK